jgi:hypothetical protein
MSSDLGITDPPLSSSEKGLQAVSFIILRVDGQVYHCFK